MSKYKAKKAEYNGITFDSTAERDYYLYLLELEKEKLIEDIQLQPKFKVIDAVDNHKDTFYVADFMFNDKTIDKVVVVDVKGMPTPEAILKKKLFLNLYPELQLKWICRSPKYIVEKTGDKWIDYESLKKARRERKKLIKRKGAVKNAKG